MDERKVTRKLEQVEPPKIELKDARARLRRELLTSPEFETRTAPGRGSRWRLALAGLVMATAVVAIVFQFVPRRSSAEALIAAMGSAYDASVLPDAVHYLKQRLDLNDDRHVLIESWRFPGEDKFRVRIKDAVSAKTLGHLIMADGRTWDLPESPIHVAGEVRAMTRTHVGEAGEAREPGHLQRIMTIVVERAHPGEAWSDTTRARAYLVSDFFSSAPAIGRTPHDLVRELQHDGEVAYAGATLNRRSRLEAETLERRNAGALPFVVEFRMEHIEQVQAFLNRVLAGQAGGTDFAAYRADLETRGLGDAIALRPVEPVERIEVDSATSRIRRLSLSIVEHGREIYAAETTFLEDRYVPYAPDTFDPDLYGLSPATPARTLPTQP